MYIPAENFADSLKILLKKNLEHPASLTTLNDSTHTRGYPCENYTFFEVCRRYTLLDEYALDLKDHPHIVLNYLEAELEITLKHKILHKEILLKHIKNLEHKAKAILTAPVEKRDYKDLASIDNSCQNLQKYLNYDTTNIEIIQLLIRNIKFYQETSHIPDCPAQNTRVHIKADIKF